MLICDNGCRILQAAINAVEVPAPGQAHCVPKQIPSHRDQESGEHKESQGSCAPPPGRHTSVFLFNCDFWAKGLPWSIPKYRERYLVTLHAVNGHPVQRDGRVYAQELIP